jgi:hypothetical protein
MADTVRFFCVERLEFFACSSEILMKLKQRLTILFNLSMCTKEGN